MEHPAGSPENSRGIFMIIIYLIKFFQSIVHVDTYNYFLY